jgi:hypothetical protein
LWRYFSDIESSITEQIDLSKAKKTKAFETLKTRIGHVFTLLDKPELCEELDDRIGKYYYYDLDKILDGMVTPEFEEELENDTLKPLDNDLYMKEIISKIWHIFNKGSRQVVDEFMIKHKDYFTELKASFIRFREQKCERLQTPQSLSCVAHEKFKKFLEIIGIEDHNDPSWDKVSGIVKRHYFVRAMPKYTPEFWKELKAIFNSQANRA